MNTPLFDVLCIMRNSARTLPLLFRSLKEFQSRGGKIFITDTGSTDGSADLARSLGATVSEVGERFIHTIDADKAKAINDFFIVEGEPPVVEAGSRYFHFAEARNYCLTMAENDWVAWIDSDEAYVRLDIDKINEAMSKPEIAHLEYNFCFGWHRPPNLDDPHDFGVPGVEFVQTKTFRRSRMSWGHLPVHELVTPLPSPAPGGLGRLLLPKETFYLGHWQVPSDHRANYLVGLSVSCFDEPTHDRNSHYAAREFMWTGRYKSAIKEFTRHIAMNGWPAERAQSMIFIGDCWGALGDPAKQNEWYGHAFFTDPTRREALIKTAYVHRAMGRHAAVAAYASAALEVPFHPYYANQMEHYRDVPYALRYAAKGWLGDIAAAQRDILQALTMNPFHPDYNRDVAFYFDYDTNKAPEGWMVAPELLWLHDNAKGKKRILELGSWKGRSTHALCTGAAKTGGTVYAVDHFGGSIEPGDLTHGADAEEVFRQFSANTKQFNNLVVRRADSLEAVKEFPDGYFDLAFVDASHDFDSVLRDLRSWAPKVKSGGILSGHDFSDSWPGCRQATLDFLGGPPDGVTCSVWHKRLDRPDRSANPLLLYLTDCVKKGLPVSFIKLGDGEKLCMDGATGANCDGHPYSPELAQKLKTAFWHMQKLTAPREGRTWVNIVPFEDQPFYNCLLHRVDSNFDAVKDFWRHVRESDVPKVFVGPARLAPVAKMLRAEQVEIPLVNAFSEYERIREALLWKAKGKTIFIFCASMVGKVWMAHLLEYNQNISCIDAGSAFDPLIVGPTRTEQLPKWLLEREYKEWME